MRVTINGDTRDVADGLTVEALVEELGLAESPVVVQCNDAIIERTRYAEATIAEGDVLELVRFVGGG
jgi:sulfur carrier protein